MDFDAMMADLGGEGEGGAWFGSLLKADAAVGGAADGKKRKAEAALAQEATDVAKGAKGKDDLKQLVVILARLTMINSRELANLCGVVYNTFLLSDAHFITLAGLEAGERYNKQVEELKEKKAGGEEVDMASPGPPHLLVFAMVLAALASHSAVSVSAPMDRQKEAKEFWLDKVKGGTQAALSMHVRYFRVIKPRGTKSKRMKDKVKFVFAFSASSEIGRTLETWFLDEMRAAGAEVAMGAAPRGELEREAARLISRLQK
ncbi:unnamed protein product [Prorocentrum cordatum]|uniref:Uncharacterized protein n=1 Tax=Prorocentrum cordatum TaxID=2364126 RepID=A0ABN9XUA6_9DINO|nr:unnamed protein product [Polarella glacialis]